MKTEYVVALIGTGGTVATGAATVLWGPRVKAALDRRHRTRELADRYSPPLLQAAYDLQSRLYNIVRGAFLSTYMGADEELRLYAEDSTLWLLAQYLGWVEILRRDVQFLEFGKAGRNRALQEALGHVASALASDAGGRRLAVFRTNQRAIGELMIAEVEGADGAKRKSAVGYAEFVRRLVEEPKFAAWFSRLKEDLEIVRQKKDYTRLIRVQRALVDLVDHLDPDRVRYPDVDQRGKLPLGLRRLQPRLDAGDRLARFYGRASDYGEKASDYPIRLLQAWEERHGLELRSSEARTWVYADPRWWRPARAIVTVAVEGSWLEVYGAASASWLRQLGGRTTDFPLASGGWRFRGSRKRARQIVNDLLAQLERPPVQ